MEAERRQVTVLFADMVGFTAFSDRAGDEAAFTLMQSLAKLMEDAVREQGGVVQSFTGDGIMAVFGAPIAFEDAPLRACRAAVAILERLKSAGDDLEAKHEVRPQLRIGLNSGAAVVGRVQGGSDSGVTVLGDTVNVAARLQSLAEPGSAVISEATHRLVDGLVEAGFAGEHRIKGKSDAQPAYRLDSVRERTTRFDAKMQRGLTRYIGRDRELEILERGLDAIGAGVQVFDIVGEPGIGKSRLVHEFLQQIVKDRAPVLVGSCAPDGQQAPFRVLIEIVRAAFVLSPGDSVVIVARKLDDGLQAIGLRNEENLGLLLNLLGLKPLEGLLEGLDGVLTGLRTRELLQRLVQARSRLTPTILVFEDLHWLDSASEDLLAKIVAIEEPLQLLILHTRRPEYTPPWVGRAHVMRLPMEPLSARETARIAEAQLGVDHLPEALAKVIAAKAEGNPLFAEEIATFLLERGMVHRTAAGLDFNSASVATVLPESVQSLLSSRMSRLAPADRRMLHSAAVVGRRFDPDLVAAIGVAADSTEASFAAVETLGLIHRVDGSSDYVFKHALVRDALYSELLSGPRATMHLRAAEELERRGGNRVSEIVDSLAYHYAESERRDKAFTYSAMAGDKCLDIYAITEAEQYYREALKFFETQNACADRLSVIRVVVRLLQTLLLKGDYGDLGRVAEKFTPLIAAAGETPELVIAQYYRGFSLFGDLQFRAAHDLFVKALAIAERLRHVTARAYARCGLLQIRTVLGLDSLEVAGRMQSELMRDSTSLGDNYILNWSYFAVALDYMYRGLYVEARETAKQLIASGQERNDPRGIGFANVILGWINIFCDVPEAAAANADECLRVAVTPSDRLNGAMVKAVSNIIGGRAGLGLAEIDELIPKFERLGFKYSTQHGSRGAALAMCGRIAEGVDVLKQQIDRLESTGDRTLAAWTRVTLAEVYIHIASRREKTSISVILKNFRTIMDAMLFGPRRARTLLLTAAAGKHLSERGLLLARINFDLGMLSAMRKKRDDATCYFNKARVGAESQGADKLLQKIDTALAELQGGQ